MPALDLTVPSLLGGISKVSMNQRLPFEVADAVNVEQYADRGTDKRPGTEHIDDALNHNGPTNTTYTFWINRADDEQFVCFLDPAQDDVNILQIYALDGTKQTIVGSDGTNNLGHANHDTLRDYLTNGTASPLIRFRHLSIEDSTFLLNRSVTTALTGRAITYKNADTPAEVRNQNNDQNVTSWSDFNHPPTVDVSNDPDDIPIGDPGDGNVDFTNNGLWYARDDDVGLPSGFYFAISDSQPPWFQRVRTEGANSIVDEETMPLRLDWDGSKFTLSFVDWTPRLSGDSTTNPGPSFIGNAISDIAFHQGRLWFASGGRMVSSRLNDLFNLWVNSVVLQTDRDPIDIELSGTRYANIDFITTFREAVVCLTDGRRQVEIRANGPISPQTVMTFDSTNLDSVPYIAPVKLGSDMYFFGERDFSNVIWRYQYSDEFVSNSADEITQRVRGLIPAQASRAVASEGTNQIIVKSEAEPNQLFVCLTADMAENQRLYSWYRWDFGREVVSMEVVDEYLYLVFRDADKLWLERMYVGYPQQDTDGTPVQTLFYNVRIDRKVKLTGVYDAGANTTTWTVPYEDENIDEVILGPTWDTEDQKFAGARLGDLTVTVGTGETTVTIDGDYQKNADGNDAAVFVGRSFTQSVRLNELFVRNEQGRVAHGNVALLRARLKHRDAAYYRLEITPRGRSTYTHEFVLPFIGSTPLDGAQLEEYGEFRPRIMANTQGLILDLINDSPFPCAWVDLEIRARFTPSGFSLR